MMHNKNRIFLIGTFLFVFVLSGCFSSRDLYKSNYPDDIAMQKKMEKEYGNTGPVFFDLYKSEVLIEVKKGSVFVNIEDSRKQSIVNKTMVESEILKYLINSNCTATFSFVSLEDEAVFQVTSKSKSTEYILHKSDFKGKTIYISNYIN